MSCTPAILPPFPTLPAGISITPPSYPPIPADLTLCCKLVQFNIPLPPIPLPPLVLNAGVAAAITAFMSAITTYIDALPLFCPREPLPPPALPG